MPPGPYALTKMGQMPQPGDPQHRPTEPPTLGRFEDVAKLVDSFLAREKPQLFERTRTLVVQGYPIEVTRHNGEEIVISISPIQSADADAPCDDEWQIQLHPEEELPREVFFVPGENDPVSHPIEAAPVSFLAITNAIAAKVEADRAADTLLKVQRLPNAAQSATVAELIAFTTALEADQRLGARSTAHEMPIDIDPLGIDCFGIEAREGINLRLSVDQALAPNLARPDETCSISWSEACEKLGLPVCEFQNLDAKGCSFTFKTAMPNDLGDALAGKSVERETQIQWHGRSWLVVALTSADLAKPVRIGDTITPEEILFVSVVPSEKVVGLRP